MIKTNKLLILILGIVYFTSPSFAEKSKEESSFIPFKHINGIIPGVSKISEAIKVLGEPTGIEFTETWEVSNVKGGGNKKFEFREHGIFIIVSKPNVAEKTQIVDSIFAEAPYHGRSPNGLYIGMPKKEALEICRRDYIEKLDLENSIFFAQEPEGDDDLQLWFEEEKLIRVKLYPEE